MTVDENTIVESYREVAGEAQQALIKAIENRKDLPLFTVDPAELTVPTESPNHRGVHARIYKGIRDGKLVAIKVLKRAFAF